MRTIRIVLIVMMAFTVMGATSWAGTYYIDNSSGIDINPGTLSQPWKSIGKANDTLKAGDTVYIKNGIYKETIRPKNSGTVGNSISYKNYNNDEVVITGVSDGIDIAERKYIIIDGLNILNVSNSWVNMSPNGSYNTIKNCHMEEAGGYTGIQLKDGSNYNKITNNTLIGRCSPSDLIHIWNSNHNLLYKNNLYYGVHTALSIQDRKNGSTSYNIVKENYIQNKWHHNIAIVGAEYLLLESNIIVDAGDSHEENSCGTERDINMARKEHKGISIAAKYGIFRNNISINNGSGIALLSNLNETWIGSCENNRIYNNTINKSQIGIRQTGPSGSISINNILKNNIIYNHADYEIRMATNTSNYYANNNIYGTTIDYGDSDKRVNNMAILPMFIDETNRNFYLKKGSPMINSGAFLTTTKNDGNNSTTIYVDDARYFTDGWGVIDGDLIKFEGQTKTAKIINIDYSNRKIIVDTPLSWTVGTGVSLNYQGSAPEIGALEFAEKSSGSELQPPESLRIAKIQ